MPPNDPSRRIASHALLWLAAANAAVMSLLAFGFLRVAGESVFSGGGAFGVLAFFAQVSTVVLLLAVPLALLLRVPSGGLVVRVLAPLAFGAALVFLVLDREIYDLFRFHVNGLVLDVVSSRAGWESMHLSETDVVASVAAILGMIAAEYGAHALLLRLAATRSGDGVRLARRWGVFAGLVLAAATGERAIYAASDLHGVRAVTTAARVVPLYQPFTIKRFAKKWLHMSVELPPAVVRNDATLLRYPRAPLTFDAPAHTPNVLWITLDSWRADAFGPEITPNAWALAQHAQVFTHHVSGGNSTRFGVFSMFYGLDGCYWQNVLNERAGPVLFPRLHDLGYRVTVAGSASLDFPEFRSTVFAGLPPGEVHPDLTEPTVLARDARLVSDLHAFLDAKPANAPFFAWLFFDSSHAPYDYDPRAPLYTPVERLPYSELGDRAKQDLVRNLYKDAVHDDDVLIGRALDDLRARGLLDSTVVILTGDHGEEFYEHGYWGHNGAFTPEQVRVPLVVAVPWMSPARVDRPTEHQDLAPTLLAMLGARNDAADYSQGRPLFGADADPYLVSCGWDQCAVLDSSGAMVFGTEPYNASAGIDVRDADYREVPAAGVASRSPELVRVMSDMSAFLK